MAETEEQRGLASPCTKFVAWRHADELGEVTLPMPGTHNVLNALGVLAISDFLALPFKRIPASAKVRAARRPKGVKGTTW